MSKFEDHVLSLAHHEQTDDIDALAYVLVTKSGKVVTAFGGEAWATLLGGVTSLQHEMLHVDWKSHPDEDAADD